MCSRLSSRGRACKKHIRSLNQRQLVEDVSSYCNSWFFRRGLHGGWSVGSSCQMTANITEGCWDRHIAYVRGSLRQLLDGNFERMSRKNLMSTSALMILTSCRWYIKCRILPRVCLKQWNPNFSITNSAPQEHRSNHSKISVESASTNSLLFQHLLVPNRY